jgi:LPS sulfotransferase NodH
MQVADRFEFEFDAGVEPTVSYVICSLPRSGSSLLCEMLANTLRAGMPAEYFRPDRVSMLMRRWCVETFDDYLHALLERKTSPNGVFGMKMHWGQFEAIEDRDFATLFPNLRFLEIRREDRLRQAVSLVRAHQTGWWASDMPPRAQRPAVFDRDEIARRVTQIERQETAWSEVFERYGIVPRRLTYEELAATPEGTARTALEFLGVELPPGFDFELRMERLADELSEQWVERYLAESAQGP